MPLISSPIDGSPMRQINRYGIEIDVCPTSGGIWLDKGELEKLMAFLKDEAKESRTSYPRDGRHYRHDDDDDIDYDDDYKRGYKKKSKASRIMDIFDF